MELASQLLTNYKKFDQIIPFPRSLIPSGNELFALVGFSDGGIPGFGACVYILSKPSSLTEGTHKVLEKSLNRLETKLEDLTTDIQKVNDSNVSRVLTQQEVTEPMADDAADYNVKKVKVPANQRNLVHLII